MSDPPIPKDDNNFYHPKTEQEIIDLVKYAKKNGCHLRVRGSGHSMRHVDPTTKAPEDNTIIVMLDCYTNILSVNGNMVVVEAGIHLGHDPLDPLSKPENALLYRLHHEHQLALENLGGITHKTVGGFLSTGSSGGSLAHGISDNVESLRFVDGKGEVFEVSKSKDTSNFYAALTSLGLLGVLSRVTFSCVPKFNIAGDQLRTSTDNASVDIFNDNPSDEKTGLFTFLKEKEYSRMLWWPQSFKGGKDRLQVWQAKHTPDQEHFKPQPYVEFDNAQATILYSYLMKAGSVGTDEFQTFANSKDTERKFRIRRSGELNPAEKKSNINVEVAINKVISELITKGKELISQMDPNDKSTQQDMLRNFFTVHAVDLLDKGDKKFQDYAYRGLPMDESADELLVPVLFSEIWVPLSRAAEVTSTLHAYFNDSSKSGMDKITRTGNNAWELYAAKPSKAWLSMSYSDGGDVWKDGAFCINPLWFLHNSFDYCAMFRPIWKLLKDKDIPYRLHWAKSFPDMKDEDLNVKYLVKDKYPRLPDFLALRALKDPDGIFLNPHWLYWLGISK